MNRNVFMRATCALLAFSMINTGCATSHYKDAADKETYGILGQKSAGVPNMEPEFSIDTDKAWNPLEGLTTLEESGRPMGPPEAEQEVGLPVVSLEKALEIAVLNSRTYQNEKEILYLAALSLTLDRHRFAPRYSATAGGAYNRDTTVRQASSDLSQHVGDTRALINGVEAISGTPAQLLTAYADLVESGGAVTGADGTQTIIDQERSVTGATRIGFSHLLKGGGLFALTLTSNFLRFITGDPTSATASTLAASFTQPLLRGAGADIAAETLTQSERDVLYAIRDYTQFRKEFIVQTVTSFYNVLQRKDIARNTWQSYLSFLESERRERALAREGRSTQENLGRLEQASLDNRGRWVASVQSYQQALDQFKISLGLPTDAKIVLDDSELHELAQQGILHPEITDDEAIQVALASRLDFLNSEAQVEDTARRVKVAANALKPGLDLVLAADVDTIGQDSFQRLDFRATDWTAGLNLDLPLDRKAERNTLREALIAQERSVRTYTLAEDSIKLSVRSGRRTLEQAKLEFEIAQKSVELGKRRVREQELLAELGLGTAINLVDAQNDLTSAQNDLTNALIAHTIARLEFWRDMGILYIKENGNWEEIQEGSGYLRETVEGEVPVTTEAISEPATVESATESVDATEVAPPVEAPAAPLVEE